MRVVKSRLSEMVPELKTFLDVDDLTEGKGAELVDASQVTLGLAAHRSPSVIALHPLTART